MKPDVDPARRITCAPAVKLIKLKYTTSLLCEFVS